jgi:hypothetical protein
LLTGLGEEFSAKHPHLHPRIGAHYRKHLDAAVPRERLVALAEYRTVRAYDHRDKMNAANLSLLPYERRMKLVRMLKQKGRFIQISRNMLEGETCICVLNGVAAVVGML